MSPELSKGGKWRRLVRRALPWAVGLGLIVSVVVLIQRQRARLLEEQRLNLGRDLFEGRKPLKGRISGHEFVLPQDAVVCAHCHSGASELPGSLAASSPSPVGGDFGKPPLLTGKGLKTMSRRRGGPPSVFDEQSFCVMLRSGVDPKTIIMPDSMPRYEISAEECSALWAYLESR